MRVGDLSSALQPDWCPSLRQPFLITITARQVKGKMVTAEVDCCLNDQSFTTKATIKLADGLKVQCCPYARQCALVRPSRQPSSGAASCLRQYPARAQQRHN